jgi:hypothetical protein
MMKFCEWFHCPHWAQWRGEWPDKAIRIFCTTHKEEYVKLNPDVKVKFLFAGVIPSGIDDTQFGQAKQS